MYINNFKIVYRDLTSSKSWHLEINGNWFNREEILVSFLTNHQQKSRDTSKLAIRTLFALVMIIIINYKYSIIL